MARRMQTLRSARATVIALALAALVGAAGPTLALAPAGGGAGGGPSAAEGGASVHLKAGSFDPLLDGTGWVPSAWRLGTLDPTGDLYIVQLSGDRVPAGTLDRLKATGAQYNAYLPDNAFLLKATALQRLALARLDVVRAIVPYEPYFRVDPSFLEPAAAATGGTVRVDIETFGAPRTAEARVLAVGGTVVETKVFGTLAEVPRAALPAVASHPNVVWVQPYAPRQVDNQHSAIIQGARQPTDGTWDPASMTLWSFNPATGGFEGYTGRNVTVAVSDTGVDMTHPAFSGKLVFYDGMGSTDLRDTYGHGTHTAGTVLGNGAWRANDSAIAVPGLFAGIAPDAMLLVQDWSGSGASSDDARMARGNAIYGAVISSNSWSSGDRYDSSARAYDAYARDSWPDTPSNSSSDGAQPVLYFFSAGNAGAARSIGSPAHAKNVIAVGSTGDNYAGVNWDQISGFSSRGPSDDGRIKPELVAPGSSVRSATSTQGSWIYGGHPYGDSYGPLSGTSMSCPGAAGAAAVLWEYYRTNIGTDPSPEMAKAIMINGATEMSGYKVPGPDQGFGRINLTTSLLQTAERVHQWYDRPANLATDDEWVYTFAVADTLEPFAVTLAWTDEPAAAGANPILVNNLDLYVVDPNGDVLYGNSMTDAGVSIKNGAADTLNNVEKVKVAQPARGYYEVHVSAKNVPVGTQDFALAVRGTIVPSWEDLEMSNIQVSDTSPVVDDEVTVNATLTNRGTFVISGYTVTLTAETAQGNIEILSAQPPQVTPGQALPITATWTAVRGPVNFVARVTPPIGLTEFASNNNVVNTSIFVREYGFQMFTTALPTYALDPGQVVSIRFNVTQAGNVPDNISVTFTSTGPPTLQRFITPSRLHLRPGETGSVSLTVIASPSAKASDTADMALRFDSLTDARKSDQFAVQATVNHIYGFTTELTEDYAWLEPGQSAASALRITNRGNGPDTMTIAPFQVPGSWSFEFAQSLVTLEDNTTVEVPLLVQAPERVDAGTLYDVIVRIGSEGAAVQSVTYTMNVTQVYGWLVDVDPPPGQVRGGTVFQLPIEALNLGNGFDSIEVSLQAPPGWQATLTRPVMALLPYSNLSAIALVTVDPEAVAGDYTLRFSFSTPRHYEVVTLRVTVEHVYMLLLEGPGYTLQLGQGDLNTFEVTVTNDGNSVASVVPRFEAPEGLNLIAVVQRADLERGATAVFTFQVIAERQAPAQLYNINLDFQTGQAGERSNLLVVRIDVHEAVEPYVEPGPVEDAGGDVVLNALFGVLAVVAVAMPIGYVYLRRKAAAQAPAPEVIIQTVEEANIGSDYDPTRQPAAGAAARAPARAARAPADAGGQASMEIVGICMNCGGSLIAVGNGMGRCLSCGVEQIPRAPKR
ncbi:MAG TPA: S8 family serine peptidase [Candidatus Thermoplasmatota archaeon]